MNIHNAVLETVCGITSTLPEHSDPEIAFAGKSNVGKSSLINRLMNRKSLARTSSSPGKTQTINFYRVNDRFYLVDLPGYGYARASAREKEQWGVMIERYLHTSARLTAVFLLIDIRHEPGENDIRMFRWVCECGFTPVIIATKADKISRAAAAASVLRIRDTLGMDEDMRVIPFSSVTGEGREEVLSAAEVLMGLPQETEQTGTAGDRPEAGTASPEEAGQKNAAPAKDAGQDVPVRKRWPKSERGKAKKKEKKRAKRLSH